MTPYFPFFTMLALGIFPDALASEAVLGKPHLSSYVAQARQGDDGNPERGDREVLGAQPVEDEQFARPVEGLL